MVFSGFDRAIHRNQINYFMNSDLVELALMFSRNFRYLVVNISMVIHFILLIWQIKCYRADVNVPTTFYLLQNSIFKLVCVIGTMTYVSSILKHYLMSS